MGDTISLLFTPVRQKDGSIAGECNLGQLRTLRGDWSDECLALHGYKKAIHIKEYTKRRIEMKRPEYARELETRIKLEMHKILDKHLKCKRDVESSLSFIRREVHIIQEKLLKMGEIPERMDNLDGAIDKISELIDMLRFGQPEEKRDEFSR